MLGRGGLWKAHVKGKSSDPGVRRGWGRVSRKPVQIEPGRWKAPKG